MTSITNGDHRNAMSKRLMTTLLALSIGIFASAVPAFADINATPIGNNDGFEGVVPLPSCVSRGWAVDPDDRIADLSIRILVDGVEVASGTADVFRQDLIDAGVSPDGFSGWSIPLRDALAFDEPHTISAQARDAQTLEWVDIGDPKQLTCSPTANNDHAASVETLYGDGSISCPDQWADDLSKPLGKVIFRPTLEGATFTIVLHNAAPNWEYDIGVFLEAGDCTVGLELLSGLSTNAHGAGVFSATTGLEPGVYSIQVNIVSALGPTVDPRDREIGQGGFAHITIP